MNLLSHEEEEEGGRNHSPFFFGEEEEVILHGKSRRAKRMDIPHDGSLFRIIEKDGKEKNGEYMIYIRLEDGQSHKLLFDRFDFHFMSRLFAILDTQSRGYVQRDVIRDFCTLRCPVFSKRDQDLKQQQQTIKEESPTFDQIWRAVIHCSMHGHVVTTTSSFNNDRHLSLGLEGWMVICRFIALAQYTQAKRRFSARHLQQTMRHRNAPRGSEVVVVDDVFPLAAPVELTATRLAQLSYEHVTLPELEFHVRATTTTTNNIGGGVCKVSLFRKTPLEFALQQQQTLNNNNNNNNNAIVVRRSLADLVWLSKTFQSHQGLGGTLCGRILPPFIPETFEQPDESSLQQATGAAVKAAAAGVGRMAQTLWGNNNNNNNNIIEDSTNQDDNYNKRKKKKNKKKHNMTLGRRTHYLNPNGKARQVERYLNYLLEHPALKTCFALDALLKSSQSGLAAAKSFLDQDYHKKRNATSTAMMPSMTTTTTRTMGNDSLSSSLSLKTAYKNLGWIRTAAQAAMALRVHGLLETTGLPSASAKLQHMSLPNFNNRRNNNDNNHDWADDVIVVEEEEDEPGDKFHHASAAEEFEEGVIHVDVDGEDAGLDDQEDGYDLLPLPIPAPERRILCAGSVPVDRSSTTTTTTTMMPTVPTREEGQEERFHYGAPMDDGNVGTTMNSEPCHVESAFLGDFCVDENIDKLREVIGSVDNTLSRSLEASTQIGESRRGQLGYHLDLVNGLDSWEGLQGCFISQQAIMKGAAGLEQGRDVAEESDLEFIDDLAWQAALAGCAVSAAKDVRSAVRAARTAANAKAAADAAAFSAQNACEGEFASIHEARAAQTRASMAQSHGIYAAVVEHEANTAKRRAALALAHDVKCWNVHRKRELLKTCLAFSRSQHDAAKRAVEAWSCLSDGFLGTVTIGNTTTTTRTTTTTIPETSCVMSSTTESVFNDGGILAPEEALFPTVKEEPVIHHDLLPPPPPTAPQEPLLLQDDEQVAQIYSEIAPGMESALGPPTIQILDHYIMPTRLGEQQQQEERNEPEEQPSNTCDISESKLLLAFDEECSPPLVEASMILPSSTADIVANVVTEEAEATTPNLETENPLSESMQSLVDGLMSWGGQYDSSEEDDMPPMGMTASIVLEQGAEAAS